MTDLDTGTTPSRRRRPRALVLAERRAGTANADRLRRLVDGMPSDRVALGSFVDGLGAAGTGLSLLLFGLTALIPGIAPLFGLALCAVSLGLLLGHAEPFLPARMRRWELDRGRLRAGLRRLAPLIGWVERWLRPRATGLLRGPGIRLVGAAGLLDGVLIVLPIPFGNTAPALAMLIVALGLIVGDGLAVGAGLLATLVALAADLGLIVLGYSALAGLLTTLF